MDRRLEQNMQAPGWNHQLRGQRPGGEDRTARRPSVAIRLQVVVQAPCGYNTGSYHTNPAPFPGEKLLILAGSAQRPWFRERSG